MSIPSMKYRNNDLAAHAVYRHMQQLGPAIRHLTLRPWNHYEPAFTDWWFIPSTHWPAYEFGKLYVSRHWRAPEFVGAGYYIERGLADQLESLAKSSLVMNSDWFWHKFVDAAQAGELDLPMVTVLQRSGLSIEGYLNLYHFNHVPDPETGERNPNDELWFAIGQENLALEITQEANSELTPANSALNIGELLSRVDGIEGIGWHWINFYIGVRLRYSEDDTGDWGAAQIWHNAMEPWMPWVR